MGSSQDINYSVTATRNQKNWFCHFGGYAPLACFYRYMAGGRGCFIVSTIIRLIVIIKLEIGWMNSFIRYLKRRLKFSYMFSAKNFWTFTLLKLKLSQLRYCIFTYECILHHSYISKQLAEWICYQHENKEVLGLILRTTVAFFLFQKIEKFSKTNVLQFLQ